jgi:hypothetical protein
VSPEEPEIGQQIEQLTKRRYPRAAEPPLGRTVTVSVDENGPHTDAPPASSSLAPSHRSLRLDL